MVYSYNDKLRDSLFKDTNIPAIIIYLENLDINARKQVIRLMICDYYKLNFYDSIFSNNVSALNIFNSKIDNIVEECLEDYNNLIIFIKNSMAFNNLDFISKSMIMEEIDNYDQDNYLNSISKFHVLDKLTCYINYDLENFKEYYKDYITKNNEVINNRDMASRFLTTKLLDLKNINYKKYEQYIITCIKEYYKWNLFIKNHDGKKLLFEEDYEYMNVIERYTIEELIIIFENDFEFSNTIVGEFLHYSTSNPEVNEKLVDNYLYNNSSYEIAKKLQIKRD